MDREVTSVLVVDIETSDGKFGTDEPGEVIEIAAAIVDLKYKTVPKQVSFLVKPEVDFSVEETGKIHGISKEEVEKWGIPLSEAADEIQAVGCLDFKAAVAWRAEFERSFLSNVAPFLDPWFCAREGIQGENLPHDYHRGQIYAAAGLGVPIVAQHRAMADVHLLSSILLKLHGEYLDVLEAIDLDREDAKRQKVRVVAKVSYDTWELAKNARFTWQPGPRVWDRIVPADELETLRGAWEFDIDVHPVGAGQ